jgi:hypothetical protein
VIPRFDGKDGRIFFVAQARSGAGFAAIGRRDVAAVR